MKEQPKAFAVLLLSIILISVPSYSMKKVAQSNLQFLKFENGARAVALGGAYTAVSGDPNCIFYNPAGTATVQGMELVFNHSQWLADVSYQSAVVTFNSGKYGTFSLNYVTVDYGSFERTIVDAHAWESYQSLGEFEVGEYAVGMGYATQITDRFFIGGQVKYAYQKLGSSTIWEYAGSDFEARRDVDNVTDVVAYDFGTFYNSGFKNLSVGMCVQNFANKPIPLNFRFGLAMDLNQVFLPNMKDNRITLSCDLMHPRDYEERMQYGLEFQHNEFLSLRAGYKINYDEQGFAAGLGINASVQNIRLIFDYSISDFGIFETMIHKFGLRLSY